MRMHVLQHVEGVSGVLAAVTEGRQSAIQPHSSMQVRAGPVKAVDCPRDAQHKHKGPHKDACSQDFWQMEVVICDCHSCNGLHGLDWHGDIKEQPSPDIVKPCM